jgi:hypothetical protein
MKVAIAILINRRAMVVQRECDPEETSGEESWYTDMTPPSSVDDRTYIDSTRHHRREFGSSASQD